MPCITYKRENIYYLALLRSQLYIRGILFFFMSKLLHYRGSLVHKGHTLHYYCKLPDQRACLQFQCLLSYNGISLYIQVGYLVQKTQHIVRP